MKKYIKLLRVKHYIKNVLVFLPAVFSGKILQVVVWKKGIVMFLAFSMISSAIYIINDIHDVEKDRMHPEKCKRPIASGEIEVKKALVIAFVCVSVAVCAQLLLGGENIGAWLALAGYFSINILYSVAGFKNIPLLDIAILTAGFVIRMYYGAVNTNTEISAWLYLVIFAGALFMGFGKRRNELVQCGDNARKVLAMYSADFLNKSMQACMTLSIVFYSLWCMDRDSLTGKNFLLSVPVLVFILFKYSMDIERDSDGDPVNVILGDKVLIVMVCALAVILCWNLYM